MKIVNLATDLDWIAEEEIQFELIGDYTRVLSFPRTKTELISSLQGADYAILSPVSDYIISHQIFDETPNLKGISLSTTRFDWVDTKAAVERNIVITNLGQYAKIPVSEFAIALMFALARNITVADRMTKTGSGRSTALSGFELRDKVLGIIGMGSIGTYIAQISRMLGMRVIGYNRTKKDVAVSLVPLEYLLQHSDIIIVCLAFNSETQHFLNAERLSLVKSTAIVISIAREGVIDQEVIYQFLIEDRIRGYAFELDEPREFPIKEELITLSSVIATPYTGWYTPETIVRMKQTILTNIRGMINGQSVNTVIGKS